MEHIGEIAPQVLFFSRRKAKRCASSLLTKSGAIAHLQPVSAQFVAKPAQSFCRQMVPQKLHGISVRQIQFGIGIETSQPGIPVLALQDSDQLREFTNRRVRVMFDFLPEMVWGIVGRGVSLVACW